MENVKMATEDELFEKHIELTLELGDLTRQILHLQSHIVEINKELDKIEEQIDGNGCKCVVEVN